MVNKIKNFFTMSSIRFGYLSKLGLYNWMNDEEYIKKEYYSTIGQRLNLEKPTSFNEKIQWLKLHDRKKIYTKMVDKWEVKKYVASIIGDEYIIPTLGVYDKFDEIDFDKLPNRFVIKCTHDSGGIIICKDKNRFNKKFAKRKINRFLKRKYYYVHREWPYKNVKPRIIVEKYMEDKKTAELVDYKIMCFGGKAKMLFTCTERFSGNLKVTFFDLNWNRLAFERHYASSKVEIPKPKNLDKMIKLSEKLAKDIPFVRIDWYEINCKLYFGEYTFYPGSGLEEFEPREWDYLLGEELILPSIKYKEKKNDNLISIIVPTYNSITKIKNLIFTINNQIYKKFELVFVDDGSNDGTYEFLKQYALGKHNIKVIRQIHAGPGIARKRGLNESVGNLVFFIDSDDWLPGAETLYNINQIFMDNKDADVVVANRIRYPSGEIVSPFDYKQSTVKPGAYSLDVFKDNIVVGNMSAKVFRREKISPEMFIGAFTCEDICTSYMYFDKCKTILYVDEVFYVANRSKSNNSLTRSNDYKFGLCKERVHSIIEAFNKINSAQLKTSLASIALDVYCGIIRNKRFDDKEAMRALEEVISSVDLDGFYPEYSMKKKLVLKYLKFRVRRDENED